jgi:prephenate dehydrogenase
MFLKNLKMRPEIFDPLEHDEAVAAISHLPYFVASALLQNAGAPAAKKLAASGFRSTTRVAESDPVWGLDIAKTNKKALLRQLSVLQKNLKAFKALIAEDRYAEILKLLKTNREVRRSIYP